MLETTAVVDAIEVTKYFCLQVRVATKAMDNDIEISKSYHRYILAPGDDLTNEDALVIEKANEVWTPEVIAAYKSLNPPHVLTADEVAAAKLAELDQAAANAYVAGFYSAAAGAELYYDSDLDTQKKLDGIIQRTTLPDWETKVRYPGAAPAGKAPIRAKPKASDPDSLKEIQLLDAAQLKMLVDDLDSHLFTVNATIWQKQAEVKAAYDAGDIAGIKAVSWIEP